MGSSGLKFKFKHNGRWKKSNYFCGEKQLLMKAVLWKVLNKKIFWYKKPRILLILSRLEWQKALLRQSVLRLASERTGLIEHL